MNIMINYFQSPIVSNIYFNFRKPMVIKIFRGTKIKFNVSIFSNLIKKIALVFIVNKINTYILKIT